MGYFIFCNWEPLLPILVSILLPLTDGKGIDKEGGREAVIDGSPVCSTIGALEHTSVSPSVEGLRCLGMDGKGIDIGVGQAGIDGSPVCSTIGALKHTSPSPSVEGLRCLGMDGKGPDRSPLGTNADPLIIPERV